MTFLNILARLMILKLSAIHEYFEKFSDIFLARIPKFLAFLDNVIEQ